MLTITCNGEKKEISHGVTVNDFIRELDLNPDTVVVELNNAILKRDEYDKTLEDGTVLELIRFVGGG